mmetsp:Transcript_8104/g.19873  ORF Transcript_8104/g.19873 Transcript_8104/m.19873 type:complete len:97 (+) Transcript_8104:174-464(+)
MPVPNVFLEPRHIENWSRVFQLHRSLSRFWRDQRYVTARITKTMLTVPTKNILLNSEERRSNAPEAVTRVKNKSTPYAKTRDVDSKYVWDEMLPLN